MRTTSVDLPRLRTRLSPVGACVGRCLLALALTVDAPRAMAGPDPAGDLATTDAAAILFRGTSAPTVPAVFGKLRFGMSERQARAAEPRLVATPGSGEAIFLPIDGIAGAQVRRGYVYGAKLVELALRFDAAAEPTLASLWGPAIHDGTAAIWFNRAQRLRARLDAGVLTFARYLPTRELLGPRSPFLGKSLTALRKGYGAVDRDDQGYGLGYHLPEGPALEWDASSTSVILIAAKKVTTGYFVTARTSSYPWHESILAAARAGFGAETSRTEEHAGGEDFEVLVFRRGRAAVEIKLTKRGAQVTFVEIRGRLR